MYFALENVENHAFLQNAFGKEIRFQVTIYRSAIAYGCLRVIIRLNSAELELGSFRNSFSTKIYILCRIVYRISEIMT